jgi:hypothetical protein
MIAWFKVDVFIAAPHAANAVLAAHNVGTDQQTG